MRLTILLFLMFTTAASAQVGPSGVDWKALGRPVDNDVKSMNDRYVYNNTDTISKNIPVDQAGLTQGDVTAWVNDHLGQVLSLTGKQYDQQVYNNRLVFTPTGYAEYIVYLKTTNLGTFLQTNQYKVSAVVNGLPKIDSEGLEVLGTGNTYHWQITANLMLSYLDYRNQPPLALYKDPKADNRIPMQAKIDLVRINGQNNNNLAAIDHITFVAVPTATESLDPAPADE